MMTVPERPAAPFARVFGRVVLPDGSAVSSGRLVLDPDAEHPTVSSQRLMPLARHFRIISFEHN